MKHFAFRQPTEAIGNKLNESGTNATKKPKTRNGIVRVVFEDGEFEHIDIDRVVMVKIREDQ